MRPSTLHMKAPFPWMGGKSAVAPAVWERFGADVNFVEPFFGSGAVLLGRPKPTSGPWVETVNDADGLLCNAWRAILHDPDATAHHADWPVNENDLHARHSHLVAQRAALTARLEGDPDYFDAKLAGWWIWGICCWIGSGWCSGTGPWHQVDGMLVDIRTLGDDDAPERAGKGVTRQLVHLGDAGQGVTRQRVQLGNAGQGVTRRAVHDGEGLVEWLRALAGRLARVRVCCGDWERVVTDSASGQRMGTTAVFLDPPYSTEADRTMNLYAVDSGTVAHDVRDWSLANGHRPEYRIALCGYVGEGHDMLTDNGWTVHTWKARGGMGNTGEGRGAANVHREAIWFSPHCLGEAAPRLFS